MEGVAAATIVAKNYLSFARVLASSFRKHHPDIPFFVLLTDEVDGFFNPDAEPFHLLALSDLAVPDLPRFRFHYTQQELTYAATPYLLSYLLQRGFNRAAFFKQESLVVGDLTPILTLMESSSIVLTPHLLEPLAGDALIERELGILQSGVYNVGFLGVAETPASREFLVWWSDRVYTHCRHDVPRGMHFEQRWLDLVPPFFAGVHVIRDPGFNVGHWNLPERELNVLGESFTVGDQLCRFIRFSGFEPDYPHNITRYSPRLTMDNVNAATALVFRHYLALLEEAGYHETKQWPYAYGCFDNGAPVTDRARRIYREREEKETDGFGDPLKTAPPGSYFRWFDRHAYSQPGGRGKVARLWRAARGRSGGGGRKILRTLLATGRQRLSAAAARHEVNATGMPELPRARRFEPHNPAAAFTHREYESQAGVSGAAAAAAGAAESLAVVTIVARNYLSFARVLANSFRAHHPGVPFFVLLTDEIEGYFDPDAEPFKLIRLADLAIPDLSRLRFQYYRKQFATALKPRLLAHLLDRGFRNAIFLDPDILILDELSSLFAEVRAHSITLTPHILAPLAGARRAARELNLLQAGVHNAGFIGVSDTPDARQFLNWWQQRLFTHCRFDIPQGMYYDQRWLDLAPVFFNDVYVLRDSSYNVAYWNLPERGVRGDGVDGILIDGQPCRFIHFSGFDPDHPDAVTRFSDRLMMKDLGAAAPIFRRYASLLEEAGYRETKQWPYAYGFFDNGVVVSERARRLYLGLGDAVEEFGDPFETAPGNSYFRWLKRQTGVVSGARLVIRGLWGGGRRRLSHWAGRAVKRSSRPGRER